ncbi:glycosyltransferase [Chlamydiota bacterium]
MKEKNTNSCPIEKNNYIEFSIIICTYNRASLLEIVLKQLVLILKKYSQRSEIIIVDNNSSDTTKNIVDSISSHNCSLLIKYLFEKRQGLSYARNSGISISQGKYCVFIDDDILLGKNWFENVINTFEKFPNIIGMGGKVVPSFVSEIPLWLRKNDRWRKLRGIFIFHDLGNGYCYYQLDGTMPFGANMAFRRESFEKYGFFNVQLGRGKRLTSHEDVEYSQRLLLSREKIVYNPFSPVKHIIEKERLTVSYIAKWFFFAGVSSAYTLQKDHYNLFGIPLYEVKKWILLNKKFFKALIAFDNDNIIFILFHFLRYWGYFFTIIYMRFRNRL